MSAILAHNKLKCGQTDIHDLLFKSLVNKTRQKEGKKNYLLVLALFFASFVTPPKKIVEEIKSNKTITKKVNPDGRFLHFHTFSVKLEIGSYENFLLQVTLNSKSCFQVVRQTWNLRNSLGTFAHFFANEV